MSGPGLRVLYRDILRKQYIAPGTDTKNLAKHPQKSGVDIRFMHFHFQASIKPILKNSIISIVLELLSFLHGQKTNSVVHSVKY